MTESLLLKWGTVKGWDDLTDRSQEIMNRYFTDGMPWSCATDHPDDARKAVLCELIDQLEGEIQNDWTGDMMSKDEAKKYVLDYGKQLTSAQSSEDGK